MGRKKTRKEGDSPHSPSSIENFNTIKSTYLSRVFHTYCIEKEKWSHRNTPQNPAPSYKTIRYSSVITAGATWLRRRTKNHPVKSSKIAMVQLMEITTNQGRLLVLFRRRKDAFHVAVVIPTHHCGLPILATSFHRFQNGRRMDAQSAPGAPFRGPLLSRGPLCCRPNT